MQSDGFRYCHNLIDSASCSHCLTGGLVWHGETHRASMTSSAVVSIGDPIALVLVPVRVRVLVPVLVRVLVLGVRTPRALARMGHLQVVLQQNQRPCKWRRLVCRGRLLCGCALWLLCVWRLLTHQARARSKRMCKSRRIEPSNVAFVVVASGAREPCIQS